MSARAVPTSARWRGRPCTHLVPLGDSLERPLLLTVSHLCPIADPAHGHKTVITVTKTRVVCSA